MSINLEALKAQAQDTGGDPHGIWHPHMPRKTLAALVEVAEAVMNYDGPSGHSWRCEYRTAAKGWKLGDPPIIECACGLARLEEALKPFIQVESGGH